MKSVTPTLLDPFEAAGAPLAHHAALDGIEQLTEWFDRTSISIVYMPEALEELNEPPPWTPEPVDRRWRARGWTDEG